jgi:hypothetical protein
MRRDQSGHTHGYALLLWGYPLLLWAAAMVSIALGILFRHEIRAALRLVRVLLGAWR